MLEMQANYNKLRVAGLKDNPFAEAIPARVSDDEYWDLVAREESIPVDINEFSEQEKELQILSLAHSVSPTTLYYEVYKDMLNILLMGYVDRNPRLAKTQKRQHQVALNNYTTQRSTSSSIAFFGLSGMGKSTIVNANLALIPQVITHSKVGPLGYDFKQIVYIKCDIPGSTDLKEICLLVIAQIDKITGDNLSEDYRKKGRTTKDCTDKLVTLCSTLSIGMLLFDEVQNIALAKANAKKSVITLFDRLTNEAKVPVIKIGTSKAAQIFQTEFTNMRRLGLPIEFMNYKKDEPDWELLVEYAWSYQVIGTQLPLDEKLANQIYQLTMGVPYCLFFLMEQANMLVIRKRLPVINNKVLKEVYDTKFKLMQPAIMALRQGKTEFYDDIFNLSKTPSHDTKTDFKNALKVLNKNNLTGELARSCWQQIENILPDYQPTNSEARILKRLQKEISVNPSKLDPNNDDLKLPI